MLNDTKIRVLKAKESIYRVADANGLCIEVRPSGAKLWRYRYRYAGKASMVGLGEYPATSLSEARAARDKARALVKGGANPAQVARSNKAAMLANAETTFHAVGLELLEKRSSKLSPGSIARERRLIEKDLAPICGLPVADVTAPTLLLALRKIEKRGAIETAHRARSCASVIFRYAVATGRASNNPAQDLIGALQQPSVSHSASLTEPHQVAPLLRAIDGYQGSPAVTAALKLAPMVFVRPGELRAAKWADIDLESAEWRYITSKTKTAHIVPLSTQAVEILRELRPITGRNDHVFPGVRGAGRPMSENTINAALRRMGFDREAITGHGFRAMARTILDEVLGVRPDFIEHQLAHAVRDPLGRAYNRTSHLDERKKMMQAWANYLDQLKTSR